MSTTEASMSPEWLVFRGTSMTLRRRRSVITQHREWEILPRYGTADSDRWTVIGRPTPGSGNPAADIEVKNR